MTLVVTHDGEPEWGVKENCCLCRAPTHYWHKPTDVALCPNCAQTAKLEDLPSKKEWCEKERMLRRTVVNTNLNLRTPTEVIGLLGS